MPKKNKADKGREDIRQSADNLIQKRSDKNIISALKALVSKNKKASVIALAAVLAVIIIIIAVSIFLSSRNGSSSTENSPRGGASDTGEQDTIALSEDEAINTLINNYYTSLAAGGMAAIEKLGVVMDDEFKLYYSELSKYVEAYNVGEIYTKEGASENSKVAFVSHTMKFVNTDTPLPGLATFYFVKNEDGTYKLYVNVDDLDEETRQFVENSNISDEAVIDLRNKINSDYNTLVESNEELLALISEINQEISNAIATARANELNAQAQEQGQQEPDATVMEKYVKANDTVNIRSEASKTGETVGSASAGDSFKLISEEGEWYKIEYQGKEAYVFAEFFVKEEKPAGTAGSDEGSSKSDTENKDVKAGTYKANDTCNIRKESSTNSESLGLVYSGESVEVLENAGNGWVKIKYGNITGYVMKEFLDVVN